MAATIYTINNTSGTVSISIKPNALNGPGSGAPDSDMRLYGIGAAQWGEGMDENVYRLTESFACPAKVANDYNPISMLFDYVVGADPLPKDEQDLGSENGINQPIPGQLWYNISAQKIYSYDSTSPSSTGWTAVSGTIISAVMPVSPTTGDLWYDTSLTPPLLKVYDGTAFVVVGSESFVDKSGDYMDGTLDMGGSGGITPQSIINVLDPVNPLDVVNKQTVDALSTVYLSTTNGGVGTGFDADSVDGQHSTDIVLQTQYADIDVLNKILNVDGSGSGLDADLLDGLDSTDLVTQAQYTAADVLAKMLTVDGTGSGLDAGLLEGQLANFFAAGDGVFNATNANALGGQLPGFYQGQGMQTGSFGGFGFVKYFNGLKLNWGQIAVGGFGASAITNYVSAFAGITGALITPVGGATYNAGVLLISQAQLQVVADPGEPAARTYFYLAYGS